MKKIGCNDMARSIRDIMTMANFSGFIRQEAGEPLRQYEISAITGDQDGAVILLDFAGQGFKLEIHHN